MAFGISDRGIKLNGVSKINQEYNRATNIEIVGPGRESVVLDGSQPRIVMSFWNEGGGFPITFFLDLEKKLMTYGDKQIKYRISNNPVRKIDPVVVFFRP